MTSKGFFPFNSKTVLKSFYLNYTDINKSLELLICTVGTKGNMSADLITLSAYQ